MENTVNAIKWFNSLKDKHLIKLVMFETKYFYLSLTQDLLNKALNFASEYIYTYVYRYMYMCIYIYIFQNVTLMLYMTQGNHYCLMAPIPGLRNEKVYLMCQWELMMELKCASSWAHLS